jgi:aconitate hydratase
MSPDTERIKKYYEDFPERIMKAREKLNRPLTLTEKILYAHLCSNNKQAAIYAGLTMLNSGRAG